MKNYEDDFTMNEQNMIESDMTKMMIELSMNEYFEGLMKSVPPEPEKPGVAITFKLMKNALDIEKENFSRVFSAGDKFLCVKNFIKCHLRIMEEVSLSIEDKLDAVLEDNIQVDTYGEKYVVLIAIIA